LLRMSSVILLTIAFTFGAKGQSKWSVSAKFFLTDSEQFVSNGELIAAPSDYLQNMYALQARDGKWWVGAAILLESPEADLSAIKQLGARVGSNFGHIITAQVPIEKVAALGNLSSIRHVDIGSGDDLEMDRSRADTHIDSVKAGLGALPRAFTGKDVVIAVIDWGFDFTHPNFYSEDLSTFRVVRVWDQNQVAGTPPSGFNFGSEYATENDIIAAEHDDPYTFGIGSHGTHTAGIAGGGGAGTDNTGVASDAELIFIPYRRDAASLLDAMTYVKNYANSVGKPFVFNMSTGSHIGPHDGSSLKNQAISSIVGPGAVFVGSAGNNGQNDFHFDHIFTGQDTISTVASFVDVRNQYNQYGMALPIWGGANEDIAVSFSLINSTSDTVWTSPWYESKFEPGTDTVFLLGTDSIRYRIQAIERDPSNDKPNIRLEVGIGSPYRLAVHMTGTGGRIDLWNIVRLQERYTNWGGDLRASISNSPNVVWTGYKNGNKDYGVGEPAGVGPDVISVGAYQSQFFTFTGFPLGGDLAPFTSFGPTVDGRTKPDISGPGVGVKSSISSFDPSPAQSTNAVTFNGKTYNFAALSGTSMSGPTVAGIVALMLEANPNLSAQDAKAIIIATAREDDKTGTIPANGHMRWGFGKVNAFDAVLAAFQAVSVENILVKTSPARVYPNPAVGMANVSLYHASPGMHHLQITDSNGRLVVEQQVHVGSAEEVIHIDLSGLPTGAYHLNVRNEADHQVHQAKLLINK
ncbi:MAG: S8 family peptidase, partial [Schleiferiaceae bacterium]|nr:S8 family peptidase [Schleiferiaceae bacterium]